MSSTQIVALGAIAGLTIFLGLPVGRIRKAAPRTRTMLNGLAIGILVFLLWDVLTHAWEPIDAALTQKRYLSASGNGFVMAAAFSIGLLSLVSYDAWMGRRAKRTSFGPGTVAIEAMRRPGLTSTPARRLSLYIAVGIGLHNFSEGLAIGQSAAAGDITLALLLVIGFGLHNATEGFGIVAPLAAEQERPSWGQLGILGVIGGGPTFVGTVIGQSFVNDTLSLGFLALAGGSILYVVVELLAVGRKAGLKTVLMSGLVIGVLLGFITDAIVTAAGA